MDQRELFQGETLVLTMQGDLAFLRFDTKHASVNTFSTLAVSELDLALTRLEHTSASGLIIDSGKPSFMAGADVHEFLPVFSEGEHAIRQHLSKNIDNFNRLESLPFPTVVCLNGFALGGGLELALACDFRIAEPKLRLGLPETKLGIIPGWGGTVRLPRLVGADTAIDWICSSREYSAEQSLIAGVVDCVVAPDALIDSARKLIEQVNSGALDFQSRRNAKAAPLTLNAVESGMVFESSKGYVAAVAGPHYPAPLAAVKAMQKAATLSKNEALAVELEFFLKVATGPVAKALVSVFVSDQLVSKKAKSVAANADKPEQAAVLGAGIMGGGIAYQSAYKSIPVVMKDIDPRGIDLGLKEAAKLLQKRVEKGRMSSADMAAALNRIDPTLHYSDMGLANITVEAVVENEKVKQAVLREAEAALGDKAVLTSNTSTISISRLASVLQRPEQFCGMHFFNPVHAMPLVEVIRGEQTSDQTVARVTRFALALGKKPVVVNDCPGFLVNRVLFPYFAGFALLVRDGVDYRRIDRVMEAWGWPMGPAYLLDVVGLDTAIHAESVMADGFPDRLKRSYVSIVEQLFDQGQYGQKTGAGFYLYTTNSKGRPAKNDNPAALELQTQDDNTDISDDDIVMRMMAPMVHELTLCLSEGVVGSAPEADMAMVYGTGFPAHRGGVLYWVEQMGLPHWVDSLKPFNSLGPLYQPTADILKRIETSSGFYS